MTPLERLTNSNTKGNLWIYILTILKGGANYAWDLPEIIEKKFGFRPGNITPYRVLYLLEEQGLVKSALEERRRIYKITPQGIEELEKVKKFYQSLLNKLD
ncbi:MAG TPA: PadR family transcriptional regulator [Candidatus Pacearchaeota archaeon]|jgi:DNA-binding PadR family transcriptional regulator|nr:PadR family transcriptional regulator [Candidatus Pacearchaeota archaeon]HRR94596.1 PadR family transcriptional regulator [Candidatus Paceibacterota bacterium]HPC30462.1 PadR family transcriptional regulator [Candidatus Pacearchaeota archaeon]HQG09293.1 PadR family transcriptional regulator [Candidatus Pacearchaeota archaeon]HQH19962.1 PadR family transcriptional regulator [Candidatus Pacearchaeota archaeon]